jgi:hypothetical protein
MAEGLLRAAFALWTRAVLAISFPVTGLVIPVILLILGILLLRRSRK